MIQYEAKQRQMQEEKNMVSEFIQGVAYKVVHSNDQGSDCVGCDYNGNLRCYEKCKKYQDGFHYKKLQKEEKEIVLKGVST